MRKSRMRHWALLAVGLSWALAGCSKNPQAADTAPAPTKSASGNAPAVDQQKAAQDSARAFMEASKNQNTEALKAAMTSAARQKFKDPPHRNSDPSAAYEIGEATIKEEESTVAYTVKDTGKEFKGHLKLRREDGQWKVYAITGIAPDGTEITVVDFENPDKPAGADSELKTARANMQTISNGLQAYKVRDASHMYPTAGLSAVSTDLGRDFSAAAPNNAGPGTRTYTYTLATGPGSCVDGKGKTVSYAGSPDIPIPVIVSSWPADGCFVPGITSE